MSKYCIIDDNGPCTVFGIEDPKPPRGFPPGRIRWRIRHDYFVMARVKTADGIREYIIKEENGYWMPYLESGRNQTARGKRFKVPPLDEALLT